MPAPRKYPEELKQRAVRLVLEAQSDPDTTRGAVRRIADQLGVGYETLRGWVRTAQIDAGTRPGTTSADQQRIQALEKENRELRRANEILKRASAFFAASLDRPSR
ncbi:transposase [Acidipropionibacterium acidipropionici]|uniref:Transposase n=1 Tax=Acidipropionibacterium acidipropionici TaxID=1748 RepID=A0AAC8YD61_9ACTN|nr:transposase [Acidipropionibacterium acidipropionici]AOZ45670.1 transposase [Acidipropionibacterium acidipropionici]